MSLIGALEKLATDPVIPVRMDAIKGLWQSWFWNADRRCAGGLKTRCSPRLAEPQHPWIAENLHAAVYNLADENIRYLYNNWVPLLGARAGSRARDSRTAGDRSAAGG